jgi:hypothetical protein
VRSQSDGNRRPRALWIGFYPEDAAQIANTAQWAQVGTWTIADG